MQYPQQETKVVLQDVIQNSPESFDLTNIAHSRLLIQSTEAILNIQTDLCGIRNIESQYLGLNNPQHTLLLLSLKIAKSKITIDNIEKPLSISVVFAVYKEHNRIKSKSEHPHGEDFLRRKVSQLDWLCNHNPLVNWQVIIVDDGCPEGSAQIAQRIIHENKLGDKVKVLFLADAIKQELPIARSIQSTIDSQKGGSIQYGMWHASQMNPAANHIIIYTDADLSTHLGQVGLLVKPILVSDKRVAIGSRRESDSVVIKASARNNRGKLFIYLWKRMISNLSDIIDTQCGFKAFRADFAAEILDDLIARKFAFDIELLVKSELARPGSIEKVGIAWIDSEAASTTTDLQPYLPMLKSIVRMYHNYLPEDPTASSFADFIVSLNDHDFSSLMDNIPSGITEREPIEFQDFQDVQVANLRDSYAIQ